MIDEFKQFIRRGNIIDLAVAFVMGVAFASVVNTFVDRIVNPLIGLVFRANALDHLLTFAAGQGSVGAVIGSVLNFVVIAWVLFLVVKAYNRMRGADDEDPAGPSEEILLLRQIRDSLRGGI